MKPCSSPIGRLIATRFFESCDCSDSSAAAKSARSRSSMFTNATRAMPSSSQRFHRRTVETSVPSTPEITNSAPSTTRSEPRASA